MQLYSLISHACIKVGHRIAGAVLWCVLLDEAVVVIKRVAWLPDIALEILRGLLCPVLISQRLELAGGLAWLQQQLVPVREALRGLCLRWRSIRSCMSSHALEVSFRAEQQS